MGFARGYKRYADGFLQNCAKASRSSSDFDRYSTDNPIGRLYLSDEQ